MKGMNEGRERKNKGKEGNEEKNGRTRGIIKK